MHSEASIQQALWKQYFNFDYKLLNTFIFNWECDFFARSKSGYVYEIEVKISRADFKKDFEKDKHQYFSAFEKKHCIVNYSRFGNYGRTCYDVKTVYKEQFCLVGDSKRTWRYFENRCGFWKEGYKTKYHYAEFSRIKIVDMQKAVIPNKFFYAVPEGLINVDEVPKYAGLLYVSEDGTVTQVKKAPFIHKRVLDLKSELLSKFYHQSLNRDATFEWGKMYHECAADHQKTILDYNTKIQALMNEFPELANRIDNIFYGE